MKRLIVLVLLLVIVSGVFTWFVFPEKTSRMLISLNNASAGLSAKTVQTAVGDIHYLEGGEGDTIVLLHGIFARKEHWVDLARHLTANYHVIALDLPGFGDNKQLDQQQYYLDTQAAKLQTVLNALNIKKAHIAANSMGAQIAALLAQKRPELFNTFALIGSPLGVPTKIKSDMDKALANQQVPLLVKTEADFIRRNEWLFPSTPFIPAPIMNTWMAQELANPDKNEEIWHAVHSHKNTPFLLELAPNLEMQTLIIWCVEDRIFHVSGATVLASALPHAKSHILSACGHLPMLDKPDQVGELYLGYLSEYQKVL